MGILDSLINSGALGQLAKNVISDPRVVQAATSLLSPDDNNVGANNGGLGGVLNSLRNAGMGQAADSWVGNDTNQRVSPAQLEQALGPDTVRQFGERAGVSGGESAGVLADLLPELINQMTPKGQEPTGPDLGGLLKQLLR